MVCGEIVFYPDFVVWVFVSFRVTVAIISLRERDRETERDRDGKNF